MTVPRSWRKKTSAMVMGAASVTGTGQPRGEPEASNWNRGRTDGLSGASAEAHDDAASKEAGITPLKAQPNGSNLSCIVSFIFRERHGQGSLTV